MKAIETLCEVSNRIERLDIPIKDLFNINACPEKLLPWLAQALSVDQWNTKWSDKRKREIIQAAITTHKEKGTVAGIKSYLKSFGINIHLSEWFEHDGEPFTFKIHMSTNNNLSNEFRTELGEQFFSLLRKVIDDVKPVYATYTINAGTNLNNDVCIRSFIRAKQFVRGNIII